MGWLMDRSSPLEAVDGRPSDETVRLLVASAVATPHSVGLLDPRNNLLGRAPLEVAVREDRAFFVSVRNDILALDFDSATAAQEAEQAYVRLLRAGYAPVLCASGRADHRHLFCSVPPRFREQVLDQLRLRDRGQVVRDTIRPPLSKHRDGEARSELLLPASPHEASQRLMGLQGVRALGERATFALQSSSSRDASGTIFSIALGAANAGWTWEDFELALSCPDTPASNLLGRRCQEQGRERTLDWLHHHVWCPAVEQVRLSPAVRSQAVPAGVLAAAAWAMARPWPGRAGPADFCVFIALVWFWRRSGQRRFDASERDIAVVAGISSRRTVQRALRRLRELEIDGAPVLVTSSNGHPVTRLHQAATWEIRTIPATAGTSMTESTLDQIWAVVQHDAFRNSVGLGKTGALVMAHLVHGGMQTVAELALVSGTSARTTKEKLLTMEQLGLVVQIGEEWSCTDQDWDRAATDLGALGRGARQIQQVNRERSARDIMLTRPSDRAK